jgi:hypothetical protein
LRAISCQTREKPTILTDLLILELSNGICSKINVDEDLRIQKETPREKAEKFI